MQSASEIKSLGVRIPDTLKQCLKQEAVDNRRTLNAEILIRLEESVKRQKDLAWGRKKQSDSNTQTLIEEALSAAANVSASVGLLGDLFGEMGIARRDDDARQLSRALEVIRHEAEKVGEILEEALDRVSAPNEAPSLSTVTHHRPTA